MSLSSNDSVSPLIFWLDSLFNGVKNVELRIKKTEGEGSGAKLIVHFFSLPTKLDINFKILPYIDT